MINMYRLFAVFIFAPYLIYSGYKYKDHILIILGILLFLMNVFGFIFPDHRLFI